MPVPEIFVDKDSVVFIQEDGPCSAYLPMACHAIDSTSIARSDATRVYCKDPGKRGERIVARTIGGRKEPGTLTINAWSQAQSDLLHRIWQKNCMFGAQTHFDVCGLPTDITAYTKILDYYGIMPGGLDYSNMDNLEGGEGVGLQVALSCTYDDLIEVLKCALAAVPATEITVTEPMTCIYGDLTERCASDCGVDRDRCEIIISCTNFLPGPAVAQCWYSTDFGANWAATGNAPFTPDGATVAISDCVIIEDRWIAFLGALFAGLAGRCAITDDRGATAWTAVDMGGTAATDYVTRAYVHDAGSLWACGGEATPTGHVWFSSDRGDTWTQWRSITTQILNDVATADGDTVYAVGNANTAVKSVDAGATWTALTGPAASSVDLLAVRALTNDHVLVGGNIDTSSHQLWCSLDGGETWTAQTFQGSTTASTRVSSLSLVPQAPKQHVWMTHGVSTANNNYAFRSLDGGHTWERWPVETNYRYNRIFACDSNHSWIAGDDDGVGGTGQVHYAAPVT